MKKKYVKPMMVGEQFVASEYIAACNFKITKDKIDSANCVNPAHYPDGDVVAGIHEGDHISGPGRINNGRGRVSNVFTNISSNCISQLDANRMVRGDVYGRTEGQDLFELSENKTICNVFPASGENNPDTGYCYGALHSRTTHTDIVVAFS